MAELPSFEVRTSDAITLADLMCLMAMENPLVDRLIGEYQSLKDEQRDAQARAKRAVASVDSKAETTFTLPKVAASLDSQMERVKLNLPIARTKYSSQGQ